MSLQRQASPPQEADLEATAELPVLDVMAYEASSAASVAATDGAALRSAPPVSRDPANTALDEHRARLEINLQDLSTTLRDVEERLTRKGERLVQIERQLEAALAERDAADQRARDLALDLAREHAAATAAQARIGELQKALQERESAEEARRARDSALQARLAERNSQLQAELAESARDFEARLAAGTRDFESRLAGNTRDLETKLTARSRELEAQLAARGQDFDMRLAAARSDFEARTTATRRELDEKLAARAHALSVTQQELADARARAATYLEALQSHEGRRSVFEDVISTLEQQVRGLTAALAQRGERQTDAERVRDSLQLSLHSLERTLAERDLRIRSLEEAATARGREQEAAAHAAEARNGELETAVATQRQHVEQLEREIAGGRGELQSTTASLQAALTERNARTAQLAASEVRIAGLEGRILEQQETVRLLQAESNSSVARVKELEADVGAAEEMLHRLEGEVRAKSSRVEELEKIDHEWRATVDEARHAITDRDNLIRRLEQETANSAVLVGHIQRSITRLDQGTEHTHDPAPDGATRLLIRIDGDTEVVHVLGRKTSVGRTPDNDLQIDAKFISRHHAVILAGPAHAIIEDLNSTNGVLVNNRRITRQPLKDGDNVVIGKTQFRFVVRTPAERR